MHIGFDISQAGSGKAGCGHFAASPRESARACGRLFDWKASAVALLDLCRETVAAPNRRESNVKRG